MHRFESEESRQIAINTMKAAKLRYQGMANLLKEILREMRKTLDKTKVSGQDGR